MTIDIVQQSYNKITSLPQLSYNITSYLMDNDDLIWRLLKYTSPDAWNENVCNNLTKAEKGALIWKGFGKETDYRVFFDVGDESWTDQATILRIMPVEVVPTNYVYGCVSIGFQVYTHKELSALSDYSTRNVSIIQRLIDVLNGADIEGIGRMFFNIKYSTRCRISVIGQPPMKGMSLIMAVNSLG